MRTSSRSLEGVPGTCPACGTVICLEPAGPVGDAPCPYCGQVLWFIHFVGQMLFYRREDVAAVRRQKMADALAQWAKKHGADLRVADELDSLDIIDVFHHLERALCVRITDESARRIRTFRDVMDLLVLEKR
jgi:acyl carrier protein